MIVLSYEEECWQIEQGCRRLLGKACLVRILVIPITGSGFIRSPDLPNATS